MANGSSDVSRGTVRPGKRILVADELIGQKIKIARREAGVPQEGLAEFLGLTFQQVQKYENGKNRVSAGKLAIIADFLGKPITWFYEGVHEATAPNGAIPDLSVTFLATPGATELARAYTALPDNSQRQVVVSVATCLAEKAA